MSDEYGRGGNPEQPQNQPNPPQYQPDYTQPQPPVYQQPQPGYYQQPPQGQPQPPYYQPQPGDYANYQQQQYAQYQPPAPAPVKRGTRGLVTFLVSVLVIAGLAVGGFFIWQNVLKPVVAGVAADKMLPSSTVGYFSYDARPSADQQANWAKITDAFTSNPKIKEQLAQVTAQSGVGLNYIGQFASQCGQSGSKLDASILSNLGEFATGNTTIAYLQPTDDEIRRVFQTAAQGMGGSSMARPGLGGSSGGSTSGMGNQQAAACAALHLFEDHAVAIVELDVNPLKSDGLISKLQAYNNGDKGQLTKDETYNGVDIYKFNFNGAAQNFYGLLIGKEAVVTANKDTAKLVVDAYKDSSKSLSANANYTAALAKLPADRTVTSYMDSGKVAGIVSVVIDEASKMSPSMGSTMGSMKSMYDQMKNSTGISVLSVAARSNGIQIDSASAGTTGDMAFTLASIANRDFVNRIPDGAWGFFASNDLKGLVNQYFNLMDKQKGYFQSLGMGNMDVASIKQQFKQASGLDLDEDILNWMGGEYGAYLLLHNGEMKNAPDYVFALNIKDSKDKATTSLQKINQTLKDKKLVNSGDQYSMQLDEVQVAGSTFYRIASKYSLEDATKSEDNGNFGYYGIVGDYFIFSDRQSAIEAFNSAKGGFVNSANYKSATASAVNPNGMLMYVDIQAIREGYEKYINDQVAQNPTDEYYVRDQKNYNDNIKPWLTPFKGVAMSGEASDKASQHAVMFIGIEK